MLNALFWSQALNIFSPVSTLSMIPGCDPKKLDPCRLRRYFAWSTQDIGSVMVCCIWGQQQNRSLQNPPPQLSLTVQCSNQWLAATWEQISSTHKCWRWNVTRPEVAFRSHPSELMNRKVTVSFRCSQAQASPGEMEPEDKPPPSLCTGGRPQLK